MQTPATLTAGHPNWFPTLSPGISFSSSTSEKRIVISTTHTCMEIIFTKLANIFQKPTLSQSHLIKTRETGGWIRNRVTWSPPGICGIGIKAVARVDIHLRISIASLIPQIAIRFLKSPYRSRNPAESAVLRGGGSGKPSQISKFLLMLYESQRQMSFAAAFPLLFAFRSPVFIISQFYGIASYFR